MSNRRGSSVSPVEDIDAPHFSGLAGVAGGPAHPGESGGEREVSAVSRVRILSISDDDGLRLSRELLLQNDGYELESLPSNGHLAVAQVRSFDIAIVCQSVEGNRAARLGEMLRRYNPSIRILRIGRDSFRFDPYCDANCEILAGPRALLNTVSSLRVKNRPAREP